MVNLMKEYGEFHAKVAYFTAIDLSALFVRFSD